MSKRTSKILKTITGGLVAVVSLVAFLVVGVRLVGLQVFAVLSSSMEPDYPTGSLVYVKEVDPAELEVGDVITFLLSHETTATHRIIEILPDENDPGTLWFRTKGDANEVEDTNPVQDANVVGTPVFVIPHLGYVIDFIQKPPGLYLAISVGLILAILVFMVDYITNDKNGKEKQTDP